MASTVVAQLGLSGYELPTYHQVPETTHELEWADLASLDLSKFDEPGGKRAWPSSYTTLSRKSASSTLPTLVVAPPPDQVGLDRLGVLYFVRPEDSMELKPIESRVLEKLGYSAKPGAAEGITAGEWVKARVMKGVSGNARSETAQEEILPGVTAKYYD